MLNTAQKIAVASLASKAVRLGRRLVGRGPEVFTNRHGVKWHLDLREGIDFSIYLLGSFEPATVRCYECIVKAGDVVLDIGANIGAHTLPRARLVGDGGRVIAFEPTRYAFEKLLSNIALNPALVACIDAQQTMLVAESSATVAEAIYSSWPLEHRGHVHAEHRGRLMNTTGARAATLDSVLRELNVERVDFVKLDVDGNEHAVLSGARETLRRHRPRILMELAPYVYAETPQAFDALLELMWAMEYSLVEVQGGDLLPRDVGHVRARIPSGGSINVIASTG